MSERVRGDGARKRERELFLPRLSRPPFPIFPSLCLCPSLCRSRCSSSPCKTSGGCYQFAPAVGLTEVRVLLGSDTLSPCFWVCKLRAKESITSLPQGTLHCNICQASGSDRRSGSCERRRAGAQGRIRDSPRDRSLGSP